MKSLENKWIVYDGNCGLCINSKKVLSSYGVIPEERCVNYYDLSEEQLAKVDHDHFKYEMALADEGQKRTLYGLEGILFVLSANIPLLARIKPGSRIFKLIDFLYHTISFNRYFIFPRKSQFACDCEPPLVKKFLWSWIGHGILISLIISGLLGIAISKHFDLTLEEGIYQTLLIVGSGWGVQLIAGLILLKKERFFDYSRHIALIMVIGVVVLIPSLWLSWLPSELFLPVLLINVFVSSFIMLKMHLKRTGHMQMHRAWNWSWFFALQSTALFWMFHFNLL